MALKPDYVLSLEKSASLVKATLESSNDGILIASNDGVIIDYNQKFAGMWRIPKKILETRDEKKALDMALAQLINPEEFLEHVKQLYQQPQAISFDMITFKDGRVFERYSHPYIFNEKPIGRIWCFRDVTRRSRLEEELQYHITHDVLTGLANRLSLFDQMRQAISIARLNKELFALYVIDLDRFKLINDSLTHMVGDELLRVVAKRLQSVMREGDTLARMGSDEFVVVATHLKDQEQATAIAKNILGVLHQPFKIADREVTMTASIGMSLFPKDGETVDILLRNADTAVYRAKTNGANRIEYYTLEMNNQALARLDQETQLRYAILNNEFILHYQPQFNTVTRKLMGVEALIRWQHPEKGLLQPSEFIPLAEETGLIVPIGEWVLKTACLQAKTWQNAGLPFFRMAVNIAAKQFKQDNIVEMVHQILQETELNPRYLELEITENIIINTVDIISIISSLKNIGIEITLDDFGMGFSSLSYLKKLPLNRIKIDRSFIQHVPEHQDDKVLVRAIIAMAKAFGLEVLAEGVETKEQLNFLKEEKCHAVQGFYFSESLPSEELTALIPRFLEKTASKKT